VGRANLRPGWRLAESERVFESEYKINVSLARVRERSVLHLLAQHANTTCAVISAYFACESPFSQSQIAVTGYEDSASPHPLTENVSSFLRPKKSDWTFYEPTKRAVHEGSCRGAVALLGSTRGEQ